MPRFTGRQYPGAMKDHRAAKRAEAEARQARSHARAVDGLNALAALGTAIAAPFIALADAFVAVGEALTGVRKMTQDDFALVPSPAGGGAEPAGLYLDKGGVLPGGVTRVVNTSGSPMLIKPLRVTNIAGPEKPILTPEEWAEVRRLAKERGADQ